MEDDRKLRDASGALQQTGEPATTAQPFSNVDCDQMLESLSSFVAGLLEVHHPTLGEHQLRMGNHALEFAHHIGCSAADARLLSAGARLHDIGKLAVSQKILNKPGRLTAAELAEVRTHPDVGFALLRPLNLDARIGQIVRFHHENFDGTGYPCGLAGTRIPFLARAVRILDSYDALTSHRPYHSALPGPKALARLRRDAGFYDPDLLQRFCQMFDGGIPAQS